MRGVKKERYNIFDLIPVSPKEKNQRRNEDSTTHERIDPIKVFVFLSPETPAKDKLSPPDTSIPRSFSPILRGRDGPPVFLSNLS